MSKKVADKIAETLAAVGVKRVYGVVGVSISVISALATEQFPFRLVMEPVYRYDQSNGLKNLQCCA